MGRLRSGQQQSGQPERLRNVQLSPWQVNANVLLITVQPARPCALLGAK
jgi:hypothetical protein